MIDFTTKCVNYTDCNGKAALNVVGLEMDLLTVVLHQMNMTFIFMSKHQSVFIWRLIRYINYFGLCLERRLL